MGALLVLPALQLFDARPLEAQTRGVAPIVPAATIGTVTDASTVSVLGMASLPQASGHVLAQRNDVWVGATQPLAQYGRLRLALLARGAVGGRDVAGRAPKGHGVATLRARARVGEQQLWSAVSYGWASTAGAATRGVSLVPAAMGFGGMDARPADTTVSRRIDVGQIGRVEAGVVRAVAGLEIAMGVSMERATRVTTQTITIDAPGASTELPMLASPRVLSHRTVRSLQRRDVATGMASVGFQAGAAQWLVSVTAPVASWISSDALAPTPARVPTVASVAVVKPVNGWLSLVGAAASNAATIDGGTLRDAVQDRQGRRRTPVVAFGVRLSRLPWSDGDGTPSGILAFETRTLGAVDAASLSAIDASGGDSASDTLRVVLLIDAPRAESVELMGDATAWSVTRMRRTAHGRWRAELQLAPGMHRITVRADGGKWMAPPGLPIGNDDYGEPVGLIHIKGWR